MALLIAVLIAVYLYSARVIRSQAIRSANSELTSLLNVAQTRPPQASDAEELRQWTEWMAKSGARVTDRRQRWPGFGRFGSGRGQHGKSCESTGNRASPGEWPWSKSVHRSVTLDRELVYQAVRYQEADGQSLVIRLAVPLSEIDLSVKELRGRLLIASFVMLLIGGLASLGFARMFAARIERLKDFSQRIAEGNFRPLLGEGPRDELSELADSMNQTAARLDQEIRMLSGERNRSSAILRSMVEGVAVIDAAGAAGLSQPGVLGNFQCASSNGGWAAVD